MSHTIWNMANESYFMTIANLDGSLDVSRSLFLNRWLLFQVHFKFLLRPDLDVDIHRLWWRGWFWWHNHLERMLTTTNKEHVSIVSFDVLSILTQSWFTISQGHVIGHQTGQIPCCEFVIWKVGCDLDKNCLWKNGKLFNRTGCLSCELDCICSYLDECFGSL